MATITRDDGTLFAIYTYRELITAKKGSLLKNELMLLARDNGEYARFYDKPGGDFEAVFGHETGYLLGENIWHYFNQPDNLIYCEQMADREHALLVVVRDGNVFIDAHLPLANLLDEFLGLIAGNNQFDIYIYGDLIPLAEQAQEDKFAFDPQLVKTFNVLEAPIFDTLPLEDSFQLITLSKAIAELHLQENTGLKWGISLIVLLGLAFGIYKTMQRPEPLSEAPKEVVKKEAPVDPYLGYRAALSAANPADVIRAAWASVQQALSIPGWTPTRLALSASQTSGTITLNNAGGDTGTLIAWARQQQLSVDISGARPVLTVRYPLTSRGNPKQIYQLQDTASLLYDDLTRLLPSGSVSLGKTNNAGVYASMPITITINGAGGPGLELLAEAIQLFPVQLNSLSWNIDKGVVSGTMKLTVYGVN